LMDDLRPGGNFDDLSRPEGVAFYRVKAMGKAAYPRLVGYIDNEDIGIGRAAVQVLKTLTGRDSRMPNETNHAQVKEEWEKWLKGNP